MAPQAVSPLMSDTCRECGADSGTIGVVAGEPCPACMSREGVALYPRAPAHGDGGIAPEQVNVLSGGALDLVNHPPHYKKHSSGVECVTIAEGFNFNRGNAIKYIWRAGEKGNELEDLKKSAWYLQREIARLEKP